ncbi:MAG: DMT family transporter [Oscillospiraceae bacterium]|nr:DMT family transporter [Oscillospiraceae bacterium]
MWFWFAIIALLCWSGSDLFSKIGCQHEDDKLSHLKMVMAVGVVMGLHAAYEIFVKGVEINGQIILTYLPVSALYILSMTIGYLGLRYIELSISSPICNSSGALVAILTIATAGLRGLVPAQLIATALVCVGVIGLGVVEAREDDALRAARQKSGNRRYAKSVLAIILPVVYCILDALGTFADSRVLETLDEDSANVAYELTFLAVGLVCFVYVVLIRRSRLLPKREAPKYAGAVFETAGQLAYIYALADSEHVALSAPIISAYCVVSVLWSRLFLKEKLSWKHYAMIGLVVIGIVILGVYDE